MKIHEYQSKSILRKYGVKLPEGVVISEFQEASSSYERLDSKIVVLKAQIHAGGRGKGTIYDGEDPSSSSKIIEGGVQLAKSREEATELAKKMLGGWLQTIQTGSSTKQVRKIYMEKGAEIQKEFYLSLLLDRSLHKPIFMISTEGGMDIEETAVKSPEKILRLPIEPSIGLQPWQARRILFALGLDKESFQQGTRFLQAIWNCYQQEDASLLEINPLVLDRSNELVALDCKIDIDDNSLFRHPQSAEMRDPFEEDPLELKASEYNLNYIRLEGNVGCMVNGAGLAMATMDIVKLAGASPANFLDVGGGANVETVSNGFRIILGDPNVKAIFVNIFGGIVQCDRVAGGIVEAASQVEIKIPLIVRLQGTNAEKAAKILAESGLKLTVARTLQEGAEKAAQAVSAGI